MFFSIKFFVNNIQQLFDNKALYSIAAIGISFRPYSIIQYRIVTFRAEGIVRNEDSRLNRSLNVPIQLQIFHYPPLNQKPSTTSEKLNSNKLQLAKAQRKSQSAQSGDDADSRKQQEFVRMQKLLKVKPETLAT